MKSSIHLFRIAGIDVGIHYSWLFIFILISWSLAEGVFRLSVPGETRLTYWIMGMVAAILLFICVLLHELAHSLVAKARGMSVSSITLFILGGVSNLEEEPARPVVEFAMAIVGPLTSLVLAGIFWGLEGLAAGGTVIGAMLSYLAYINLVLAIFNLIPGFPLDGGRVLRSLIWSLTGSLSRSTNIAAMVGRFFGWALIALGLFQVLTGSIFGFLGGIWTAFIGWFLSSTADASRREVAMRELLGGKKVRDIMSPRPDGISPDATVEQLVQDIFNRKHGRAVPVCRGTSTEGIVTISDIRGVPREKWATTRVAEIMTRAPLYTVSPDDDISKAMNLVAKHDVNQLLIVENGQCAGMISRADIIRYIQLLQELGAAGLPR